MRRDLPSVVVKPDWVLFRGRCASSVPPERCYRSDWRRLRLTRRACDLRANFLKGDIERDNVLVALGALDEREPLGGVIK